MKLKLLSTVEPRLVMMIALIVMAIGIVGSMTYGCILHGKVESRMRATTFADDANTTSTTTRASDAKTSATIARADVKTTATRARNAMTSATAVANRMTSATAAANARTSGSRVVAGLAVPPSGAMPPGMPGMRSPRGMGMPSAGGTMNASSLPTTFTKTVEQKGLFGRKPQMAPTLQGILGNAALINGQWVKVGENQGGVKLLELHPNKAVIEFNGSRRELTVWSEMR